MRKIRLDLDDLTVESFNTAPAEGKQGGTIKGHATYFVGCVASENSDCATCLDGCPQDTLTCMASCLRTDGYRICKDPYCY